MGIFMKKVKKISSRFINWFDHFNKGLAILAGGIIGFSTLIIIYEVIMRYLVKRPTTWVNEISEILLVYTTFLGSAWVLKEGGHTKVDILIVLMKKRRQVVMGIIQDIFSLFFCVVFTWLTWANFWDSLITQERTAGGLFSFPLWMVYIVIPFGVFLLCLQLIRQIVDNFVYLTKEHPEGSNAKGRVE